MYYFKTMYLYNMDQKEKFLIETIEKIHEPFTEFDLMKILFFEQAQRIEEIYSYTFFYFGPSCTGIKKDLERLYLIGILECTNIEESYGDYSDYFVPKYILKSGMMNFKPLNLNIRLFKRYKTELLTELHKEMSQNYRLGDKVVFNEWLKDSTFKVISKIKQQDSLTIFDKIKIFLKKYF